MGTLSTATREIINVARSWPAETLGPMGKEYRPERWRPPGPHDRSVMEYTSPMADLAPWYDPDSPESAVPAGASRIEIEGLVTVPAAGGTPSSLPMV